MRLFRNASAQSLDSLELAKKSLSFRIIRLTHYRFF